MRCKVYNSKINETCQFNKIYYGFHKDLFIKQFTQESGENNKLIIRMHFFQFILEDNNKTKTKRIYIYCLKTNTKID